VVTATLTLNAAPGTFTWTLPRPIPAGTLARRSPWFDLGAFPALNPLISYRSRRERPENRPEIQYGRPIFWGVHIFYKKNNIKILILQPLFIIGGNANPDLR
jgi:hypothetical protein